MAVSIHAPARGATRLCDTILSATKCFNPRARAGRDPRQPMLSASPRGFNPRARAGRDNMANGFRNSPESFNPRARAGRDAMETGCGLSYHLFQSTRPRGARRRIYRRSTTTGYVSIHAPARGATTPEGMTDRCTRVSIHAPARGATGLNRPRN